MSATFPLCHPAQHDQALRDAVVTCARMVAHRLRPPRLVAVILTGSFARGEGTVLARRDHLRVLGDMEFFVVVDRPRTTRALAASLPAWGREASRELRQRGVHVDVEFGVLARAHLARPRPSIFMHDLAVHGKVLAGEPDVLARMPALASPAIPPEDAVALLFNRTIEQLEAHDRLAAADAGALVQIAYERVKLSLDLAGSALAFAGAHCPSYQRRPARFGAFAAETPSLAASLPPGFAAELARAARAKLDGAEDEILPAAPPEAQRAWLRERITSGVPATAAFLRWELARLLDADTALPELLERWAQTPPPGRRAREWAKVALHPVASPVPLSPWRAARLAMRSTPRALLHAAGAFAYLDLVGGHGATASAAVRRLLPIAASATPAGPAEQRRAITSLWRWCVRNS